MDVCVVTFRNTAKRIEPALRERDRLWVRDNTRDNIGFGAACNELASRGSDPLIVFINPDGDPQPGCFDALEAAMDDPMVTAAEASHTYTATEVPNTRGWLSGACFVIRRAAFEAVGGFDPSLFLYGEDVDLGYRLPGALITVRDAVYLHDGGHRSARAEYFQARNGIVVARRHGKPLPIRSTLHGAGSFMRRGHPVIAAARTLGFLAAFAHRNGRALRVRG